jgi:N-methylhydantoinase A/oxoprolinase/acetone carboxylase beta subunit
MQSNGITTVDDVKPITLIESGPASGMLGASPWKHNQQKRI